ncbi:MAG: ectonucleotide pyrophosphatase/phosphodiesterase [bacterium]
MRRAICLALAFGISQVVLQARSQSSSARVAEIADLQSTVILIGFDGFRNDYMDKTETPNLHRLTAQGVRAEGMIPAFPSKTFPNFYTIATGLYPENNGIVGNSMFDPVFNANFKMSDRTAVEDGRWWGGEPIWVTAEKQGQKSGIFFWVGSEAEIAGVRPTFWKRYDQKVPNLDRVAQALAWLDLPVTERPRFLAIYFSDADHHGHRRGPDSPEVIKAIQELDDILGALLQGLEARGILEKVNLILVADHGMSATSTERVIYLREYIDLSMVQIIDGSPAVTLRPLQNNEEAIYRALANAHPNMHVYRKGSMPSRFHYSRNRRIPPILCLADEGWTINIRAANDSSRSNWDNGTHGYDNLLPSMRATFIAHGPAFKRGVVVKPFQNIHVYNLMAHILNLPPAPNDGSMDSVRVMLQE